MTNSYTSPFGERYSSKEMLQIFSPDRKFRTWRRLWIALARSEKKLGIKRITEPMIAEMEKHVDDINYASARAYEEKFKHDVMGHIHAYGELCPTAKDIIHLGATSMYVVDNTDLILMRDAMELLERQLVNVISALAKFAKKHASTPTVAFTHFQPAQFTTVGKRACLWLADLLIDLDEIALRRKSLQFLGVKGTTGTQASFLELFDGDEDKVRKLDQAVTRAMGFSSAVPVSGQTYSRKIDSQIMAALSGIAQSAHKFSNDMRLLQHLREIQEPFGSEQIGSSAMAYKRNPMKSERIASLSRFVITLYTNAGFTAASQWFERTLDDSAGKRIVVPEAFLATDAILQLYLNVASGLDVNLDVIERNVLEQIGDIASENLLMKAVKAGGNRQELHEVIRRHKMESKDGDLLDRLKNDEAFKAVRGAMSRLGEPRQYVGRSPAQVREFLEQEVEPRLAPRRKALGLKSEVKV